MPIVCMHIRKLSFEDLVADFTLILRDCETFVRGAGSSTCRMNIILNAVFGFNKFAFSSVILPTVVIVCTMLPEITSAGKVSTDAAAMSENIITSVARLINASVHISSSGYNPEAPRKNQFCGAASQGFRP